MEDARIQTINDDIVLEITENVPTKTRLSKNDLLRSREYFENMLAKAQAGLDDVNYKLSQIEDAQVLQAEKAEAELEAVG